MTPDRKKTTNIHIRVSLEEKEKIKAAAKKERTTVSNLIRWIIFREKIQ